MEIGNRIRQLRLAHGINQRELAEYLNLSISTISSYENGIHEPDVETICKIADFFQVNTDYILGRTDFSHPFSSLETRLTKDFSVTDLVDTTLEMTSHNALIVVNLVRALKHYQDSN